MITPIRYNNYSNNTTTQQPVKKANENYKNTQSVPFTGKRLRSLWSMLKKIFKKPEAELITVPKKIELSAVPGKFPAPPEKPAEPKLALPRRNGPEPQTPQTAEHLPIPTAKFVPNDRIRGFHQEPETISSTALGVRRSEEQINQFKSFAEGQFNMIDNFLKDLPTGLQGPTEQIEWLATKHQQMKVDPNISIEWIPTQQGIKQIVEKSKKTGQILSTTAYDINSGMIQRERPSAEGSTLVVKLDLKKQTISVNQQKSIGEKPFLKRAVFDFEGVLKEINIKNLDIVG